MWLAQEVQNQVTTGGMGNTEKSLKRKGRREKLSDRGVLTGSATEITGGIAFVYIGFVP
jgi:hypothetical protein